MGKNILVIAEAREGNLRNVTFEALAAAKRVVDGGEVIAVAFGTQAGQYAEQLGQYGANKVYTSD